MPEKTTQRTIVDVKNNEIAHLCREIEALSMTRATLNQKINILTEKLNTAEKKSSQLARVEKKLAVATVEASLKDELSNEVTKNKKQISSLQDQLYTAREAAQTFQQENLRLQQLNDMHDTVTKMNMSVAAQIDMPADQTIDFAFMETDTPVISIIVPVYNEINNDTLVKPGWMQRLYDTFYEHGNIGIAGSKLVFPTGELQEAGGIVWEDGTGWNWGRAQNADHSLYNFVRDVDYISGASLMIPTALWKQVGGFSEDYEKAYYEDTDLCFQIRELGYRVVYQPASELVHIEGLSSGTDLGSGVKKYQIINQEIFIKKWAKALSTLSERGDMFDYVILSRPESAERCLKDVKKHCPSAKLIYNTVDLHFMRLGRRANRTNDNDVARQAQEMKNKEIGFIENTDSTIVLSTVEHSVLTKQGIPNQKLWTIPLIRAEAERLVDFETTQDIAFIGGYRHPPNVDAVDWLVKEIWPEVRKSTPGVKLHICGSAMPEHFYDYAAEDIIIRGFIPFTMTKKNGHKQVWRA